MLIALAGTASAGAIGSATPGRSFWRVAIVVTAVVLTAWIAEAAVRTASAWHGPEEVWGDVPWQKCFTFTLVFGLIPAIALMRIVNRGWTLQPRATAALTYMAGAAAGALTITPKCPSHAPLHMMLGHALPIAGAAAVGVALAVRLFQPAFTPTSDSAG